MIDVRRFEVTGLFSDLTMVHIYITTVINSDTDRYSKVRTIENEKRLLGMTMKLVKFKI